MSTVLAAFEPKETAAAEELEERLEAARRLRQGVTEDASRRSHFPEADLEPVGDGMAPETSDLASANYLADAWPIEERVAADLNL